MKDLRGSSIILPTLLLTLASSVPMRRNKQAAPDTRNR